MSGETLFEITFAASFLIYAFLRRFDVASTKAFAQYVEMDKHEVNPLINWLLRRGYSLNQSFTIMLFLFGIPIALCDASFDTLFLFGVPVLAFTFGCFHIIAAANNFGYLPRLQEMSAKEIQAQEADMSAFSARFGAAGLRGKLMLLWNRDAFALSMTLLVALAFGCLYYTVGVVNLASIEWVFYQHGYRIYSLFNMGWILTFAIMAFYPIRVVATLTMARRYQQHGVTIEVVPPITRAAASMEPSAEQTRMALKLAEDNDVDGEHLY